MRTFRFKILGLTLALSIGAEVLFFLASCFLDSADQPNWLNQTFKGFHYPAYFLIFGWLDPENGPIWQIVLWGFFMVCAAVIQWWLIILTSVWVFRYFRKKSVNNGQIRPSKPDL
jgi:hypothetical protein